MPGGPRLRSFSSRGKWTCFAALLACLIFFAVPTAPAWAKSHAKPEALIQKADVKRFGAYRATDGYMHVMLRAALAHDKLLPPPCDTRKPLRFLLVKLVRPIRFAPGGAVPIKGVWAERVQLERCGRTVLHSVYMIAAQGAPSLRAVSTLPGDTITDIRAGVKFQAEVNQSVLAADAKRRKPPCAKRLIANTELIAKPASKAEPWTERWTVHGCKVPHRYDIAFTPKSPAGYAFLVTTTPQP